VVVTLLGVWICTILITFMPTFLSGRSTDAVAAAIIVMFGVSAIFSATANPAWIAVLADAVSPRRRPVVNGQRWALFSVISAITVLVAGWYLDAVDFPFGYQSLVIVAVIAGVVSLFYLDKIKPVSDAPRPSEELPSSPWRSFAAVPGMFRCQPAFFRYIATTFVYRMGLTLPAALLPIFWVDELRSSDALIGLRAMAGQAMLVASYAYWGRIAARKGFRHVLLVCGLGTALYPAMTGFVPSPLWLIPVAIIWGLVAGGVDIALFEALVDSIPVDQRVIYSAINMTFANLTILIGPLLGIGMATVIGTRPTFVFAGVCCAAGAVMYHAFAVPRAGHSQIELQPTPS
jgi:MFS family permease